MVWEIKGWYFIVFKNSKNTASAATHACIKGPFFVQRFFNRLDEGEFFKNGYFKIIGKLIFPMIDGPRNYR
jgi:hypothetical protein